MALGSQPVSSVVGVCAAVLKISCTEFESIRVHSGESCGRSGWSNDLSVRSSALGSTELPRVSGSLNWSRDSSSGRKLERGCMDQKSRLNASTFSFEASVRSCRRSSRVVAAYSRALRSSSVSLRDSDASPSQAEDDSPREKHKSFVSNSNFETDKTPSGGQRNPSLAEQLRLSNIEISKENSAEGQTAGSVVTKREKTLRYVVDRWVAPGSKLNPSAEVLGRLKNADQTEEAVREAMEGYGDSLSPKDICAVISSLKWRKALGFFRWVKSQDFGLNIVVYNVLLGTMRAGKQWQVAEEFAEEMVSDGIQLDNYTFSTLISCALQCKAPMDALKWFDKMHEAGVVPDEVTHSTMTLVYSRLGRYDDAVELYEGLRTTGWRPDKVTYGTMVNVYARAGKYHKATAVIREMKELGLTPDAVVYNTLIKFFAREGKTGQAKRIFNEMESLGVKATEFTLSLMIDVHGRSGNVSDAFQLFTRIKEENLPLDVAVYNSMLKMCGEERMVLEGESLFAEMVERGLSPDETTYKSMVNLYAKEGRIDDAVKAMQQMKEAGFVVDVIVYSCLIKSCGNTKQFKSAQKFFEDMLASGSMVDDRCCGVLLSLVNMCETEEDRSIVLECLEKAKPTLRKTVALLLGEDMNFSELDEQVRTLMSESVPDSQRPFCNSLIDFSWILGYKDRAQHLLQLADSLNIYPDSLRTHTSLLWMLHLRSLSFNTAECALGVWIDYLRLHLGDEQDSPETLIIETGAGRNRRGDDGPRLFTFILQKLKDMNAPFEASPERADWLIASAPDVKSWLLSSELQQTEILPAGGVN